MLQSKAMLATLVVRAWSARKRDKDVNDEVEKNHNAKDAGNFNKLLVDKVALKRVVSASGALRDMHYNMTLPWEDKGARLLPSKMYFEYMQEMRRMRGEFDSAVDEFCMNYAVYKSDARKRLGTLYDAEDYPDINHVRRKFEAKTEIMPVPDAKDFRVELADEEAATIREEITRQVAARQKAAVDDLWTRMREVVERMHTRLSDPEAVFRDSLVENVTMMCSIAGKLNIEDDPLLEAARADIEFRLTRVPPQRLRDDAELRRTVAKAAGDILTGLPA